MLTNTKLLLNFVVTLSQTDKNKVMRFLTLIAAVLISTTAFCGGLVKSEYYASGKIKAVYTETKTGISVVNYWENGLVREKGQYVDNKLAGTWVSYSENGNKLSEVTFSEGKRVGMAYAWDNSGELVGSIQYSESGLAQVVE